MSRFIYTQAELAEKLGVNKATVSTWSRTTVQKRRGKNGKILVYTAEPRLAQGADWIYKDGWLLYAESAYEKMKEGLFKRRKKAKKS